MFKYDHETRIKIIKAVISIISFDNWSFSVIFTYYTIAYYISNHKLLNWYLVYISKTFIGLTRWTRDFNNIYGVVKSRYSGRKLLVGLTDNQSQNPHSHVYT